MALTNTAIKDYINTYVKNNGRRSITGDQVNRVLNDIVSYIDQEIAGVGGENYSNADLVFTQSRTHNASGYAVDFQGLSQHKWSASAVPPAGEGSFEFTGYGSGSTDLLFIVKNSLGYENYSTYGDGKTYITGYSNAYLSVGAIIGTTHRSYFLFQETGYNTALSSPATFSQSNGSGGFQLSITSGNAAGTFYMAKGNFGFDVSVSASTSEDRVIYLGNGTAPTAGQGDVTKFYSADIVAGNAAPHFMTETGDVVKLYKYVDANFGNTINSGDANTDAAINGLIAALTAHGLIATA